MRKPHRPKISGNATTLTTVAFGHYALKATTGGWVTAQQIESVRRVLTRYTKKGGKIWIRIFPHRAITTKGTQATMGGGKGTPEHYVAVVAPGTVMFEMDGIPEAQIREAFTLAGYKLGVGTTIIVKKA